LRRIGRRILKPIFQKLDAGLRTRLKDSRVGSSGSLLLTLLTDLRVRQMMGHILTRRGNISFYRPVCSMQLFRIVTCTGGGDTCDEMVRMIGFY
jgi:hypothetical protein